MESLFFFEGYTPVNAVQKVEKIACYNFDKFRAVYHADPETYWNCDRILETIDDWLIFVYNQGDKPIASMFLTGDNGYFEIYGMEFASGEFQENVFRELLTAALNACKDIGAKFMTFFCGDEEKHILQKLGFACVGQYILYVKTLDGHLL